MPIATQAKLLRVLEDSRVRRLGGRNEITVDVRVVASTNKVMEEALKKGELREDLYYRLNVFHISLPPLRQRLEDIPVLSEALLADLNRKHSCRVTGLDASVLDLFKRYHWPGNVRELRNAIERAVILAGEGPILPIHLPYDFAAAHGSQQRAPVQDPESVRLPVGSTVGEAEKALILVTLQHTKNNKTRAAEILGIGRATLYRILNRISGTPQSASDGGDPPDEEKPAGMGY
jgi:transcriptional regulator with PAS, ATPase and Fis domain